MGLFQYTRTKVDNKFAPDPWYVNTVQWFVRHREALFVGAIAGATVMFFLQNFI